MAAIVERSGGDELFALLQRLLPQHLLSRGMHRLNGVYAQRFNDAYDRSGHLWGDRFVSRVIDDERYLRQACRYVVWNPVRAGLCVDPTEWRWSASRYGLAATTEPDL